MPANEVQIPAPFNTWYTIREAAEAMEYKHSQYVRKLLHDGKLGEYVEVQVADDGTPALTADGAYIVESGSKIKLMVGKTEQWRIDPAACAAYKAQAAASGGTFGQHAVRRMLFRFSTEHFTVEQIRNHLAELLGETEVDGEFRWEFSKAWKGGSKKAKPKKAGAPVVATIVSSLVSADADEDDDEDFDYDDDEDEDELEDVLA